MSEDKLKQIMMYADLNWRVLPIHYKDENGNCSCKNPECSAPLKHPSISGWDRKATSNKTILEAQWKREPRLNVGILAGKDSGIIVLDVDGEEGLKTFKEKSINDPKTIMSKTGSGGLHLIYKYDESLAKELGGKISNRVKFLPGLDLRGDSGFIVASPSEHITGNFYQWINSPEDTKIQPIPEWLKEALKSKQPQEFKNEESLGIVGEIPKGQRNSKLFKMASDESKKGITLNLIEDYINKINETYCKPPLPDDEIHRLCLSACGYLDDKKPLIDDIPEFENSDVGNGNRLIYYYGEILRFDHSSGKWLIWNGKKWEVDEKQQVIKYAEDASERIRDQLELYNDKNSIKRCLKWYGRSRNNSGLRAALENAAAKSPIASTTNEFDNDLEYFNFDNCCIHTQNLKTIDQFDIKDKMITKISPVTYDPDAICETWIKFLNEIFDNDQELIKYVQKAVGYSLTGEMREQGFFFLHGDGSNGKSTFLNIILKLFGDYGKKADINTFIKTPNEKSNNTNDLACLKGIRFIMCSEPEAGSKFSMSRIKQWTAGNEPIQARYLFKEYFEFYPVGVIWISGNEKPNIKEKNYGAWRRVKLIPFEVQIPPEKQDLELENKLTEELSGILNWVLEGLKLYREEGLIEVPEKVRLAIEAYKAEMDSTISFIQTNIEFKENEMVSNVDLFNAYKEFCNEESFRPIGSIKFTQTIEKDSRFEKTKIGPRIFWKGMRINKDVDNEDEEDLWD